MTPHPELNFPAPEDFAHLTPEEVAARITLIRTTPTPERVTFDLNLRLMHAESGQQHRFPISTASHGFHDTMINVIVLVTLVVAQSAVFAPSLASMTTEYKNVRMTALQHRPELLRDLRKRTSPDVQVRSVDYVRDMAKLQLIYCPPRGSRKYSDIS